MGEMEGVLEDDPEAFLDIVFNRIALKEGDPSERLVRCAMDLARQEEINLLRVIDANQEYINQRAGDVLEFSPAAFEAIDRLCQE